MKDIFIGHSMRNDITNDRKKNDFCVLNLILNASPHFTSPSQPHCTFANTNEDVTQAGGKALLPATHPPFQHHSVIALSCVPFWKYTLI